MKDHEYLTKAKFDEFTKELALLKGTKRKEVAESLEYAKSLGDLSENAEYHEARDVQATIEDRIAKLEELLKTASIVSSNTTGAVAESLERRWIGVEQNPDYAENSRLRFQDSPHIGNEKGSLTLGL